MSETGPAVAPDRTGAVAPDRTGDMLAVLEVIARYSHAADGDDPDAYAAVFTVDGAFVGRVGQPDEIRVEGREKLARFAGRAIANRGGRRNRHHQASTTIVSLGDDTAETRSYLMVTTVAGGHAPVPVLTSIYEDHLVRTADGWRIRERRALPDVTGTLADRVPR